MSFNSMSGRKTRRPQTKSRASCGADTNVARATPATWRVRPAWPPCDPAWPPLIWPGVRVYDVAGADPTGRVYTGSLLHQLFNGPRFNQRMPVALCAKCRGDGVDPAADTHDAAERTMCGQCMPWSEG